MGWKFVMFENRVGDSRVRFPVIFPDKMVHSDVYLALRKHMPGWLNQGVVAVSAGKIDHIFVDGLGGGSETLCVDSDPKADQALIEAYSYYHGVL